MSQDYSVEVCNKLTEAFCRANLHRSLRIEHYDPGTELAYEVTPVPGAAPVEVRLRVEKFVGGGFAGQVYRTKVLEVVGSEGVIDGLEVGQTVAMKIMVPPNRFSQLFRNVIYGIGFQGPFQLQVNPTALRAAALWQKFIRRGAKIRFGDERSVADILGTFVDGKIGSCGELSEWVEGRTWHLEVDDRLDLLKSFSKGQDIDAEQVGSPEYRTKRWFMDAFVKLVHDMGAPEFARQYEWSTCKSQPNCLKREDCEDDPTAGLVAVDFRAGLALLPFLPMSPGDFKLIGQGIARGSLVQFDRSDLLKLKRFMDSHPEEFADMQVAFEELEQAERIYRDSIPDITHNHIRLLYSPRLWSTITESALTGWQVRNMVDQRCAESLRGSRIFTVLFAIIGLIPFLGKFIRRLWGRADYRRHYWAMITNREYFYNAVRGHMIEKMIKWHRAGRIDEPHILRLLEYQDEFFIHLLCSVLPAGVHRMLTDKQYARDKLAYIFVRPIRLYFNTAAREQWLRDMVAEGRKNHIVTEEDAEIILGQIKETFIQKYLKSLAVHVCTLPVTQIVSVIIAAIYYFTHRGQPNAWAVGMGIIAAFQLTPISPGSICRGAYVVYLVIRERNFKNYNIAVFLGFFKYVGYLAFPIQMAYRYPVLARFMAAHWATGAVHIVPVFGERGALLEHGVFSLFYNRPLTIRRRMQRRAQMRTTLEKRSWHVWPGAAGAALLLAAIDQVYLSCGQRLPGLMDIWWLAVLIPLVVGAAITLGAGGMVLGRRIVLAAVGGAGMAVFYILIRIATNGGAADFGILLLWRVFIFAIFSAIGAIVTELKLPEPSEN